MQITYYETLKKCGVPRLLASKCANILFNDDPSKPNLGRTKQDQELINQSHPYLVRYGKQKQQ